MRARGDAALLVAGLVCAAALPEGAGSATPCATPVRAAARGALLALACEPAAGTPLEGAAQLLFGAPLDLNRVDAAALEALPGIGPGRAAAILRSRAERPFCSVDELARVPGLGPATVERVAPLVAAPAAPGCAGS